jgi:3-dehydroquinate synthetase
MVGESLRPRVLRLLEKWDLYRPLDYDWDGIKEAMLHDKKAAGDAVSVVTVGEVGRFAIEKMPTSLVVERAKHVLEGLKS